MKKICLILSVCVIMIMWACSPETSPECQNHFVSPYYTTTTTTINKPYYDPNVSGEIIKKYNAEAGHFANWQDGKIYVVSQSYLKIFDLTNDTITKTKQIEMKKSALTGDWNFMRCYGIADLGSKILMLVRLDNTTDSIKTLVSIKHDGSEFCLSDLTSDIILPSEIYSIYYHSDSHLLDLIQSDYAGDMMSYYLYDQTNDKLTIKSYKPAQERYITNSYYYHNYYYSSYYDPDVYYSYLSVYKDFGYYEIYELESYYLGYSKPFISCFDDGHDLFIFTKENDKYEFIKIKPKKVSYYYYE